jgi:hypothetical protein
VPPLYRCTAIPTAENRTRAQKEKEPVIKSELFTIQFHSSEFPYFGSQYTLHLADGSSSSSHYLIHFPSLLR